MAEVERTMSIPADPDRVWDEILEGQWLGDDVTLTPLVGADGLVVDAEEVRHLIVESIVPGERLVFRWWALRPDGVGPASRVVVSVDILPARDETDAVATQVVVVESPLPQSAPPPPSGPLALAVR